jgi:tetratricopeptide (TPR) repeat protein
MTRRVLALALVLAAGPLVVVAAQAPDSAAAWYRQAQEAYRLRTPEATRRAIALWHQARTLLTRQGAHARQGDAAGMIGFAFSRLGQLDSALVYHQEARLLHARAGNRPMEALFLGVVGTDFLLGAEPDSAFPYLAASRELRRTLGDAAGESMMLTGMARAHHLRGRPDSALQLIEQSLAVQRRMPQADDLPGTLNAGGNLLLEMGRPDSALRWFYAARDAARSANSRDDEASALANLGAAYNDRGYADSALAYHRAALALRMLANDHLGQGVALNNLGNVHEELGRPDSAAWYYRQALPLVQEAGSAERLALILGNLGLYLQNSGHLDSAEQYYRRSLDLANRTRNHRTTQSVLSNLGTLMKVRGLRDSARALFQKSLELARSLRDASHEGLMLNNIGALLDTAGTADSAVTYYRQALALQVARGDRRNEANTLSNLGVLHHRTLKPANLERAVVYYDSAAARRAELARSAGGDANRLSFSDQAAGVDLYRLWSLAWLARERELGTSASSYAGLGAAERGRSQGLLDLMRVGRPAALTGDLADFGRGLARTVAQPGTAVLYYLQTRDTLVIWVLRDGDSITVERRPARADSVAALIRMYRRGLGLDSDTRSRPAAGTAGPASRAVARSLANLLLPDGLARARGLRELVIVPNGPVGLVPFAALPGQRDVPLGLRYAIRYAPSLAALAEATSRRSAVLGASGSFSRSLPAALVVGNPAMPESSATGERLILAPLPGAETEGRWVAVRLGSTPRTGTTATEAEIRRLLPAAPMVHLATHGYAYPTDALTRNSYLALAPDSVHDGLLTVGEILDDPGLRLSAELVVLSACQTGLGDLKEAEGTIGFQRAFLARGARSVLVSLWNVSDSATAFLMQRYYEHWLSGSGRVSKSEALRRAQREVRAVPRFADPRYWAGFQLVGAP